METRSLLCTDPKTHWDPDGNRCVFCNFPAEPGYELSPHCGISDNGDRHEPPYRKCPQDTFNDGKYERCQPCALFCQPGNLKLSFCNSTTAQCARSETDGVPVVTTTQQHSVTPTAASTLAAPHPTSAGAVPAVITSILVAVVCACFIYKKKRRGQHLTLTHTRSLHINEGFTVFPSQPDGIDLEDILSAELKSAPLQTVLDNLDVLEELVILLDPETQGRVKSTRHLASHCSFSSTWITYTYSMKDSKSPLKAVLEGVTSKHPDWTVGELAKLLRVMERNDAVAVLTKLKLNDSAV